ncbi:hypothetical protein GA0115240_136913 [Streptomyces sp. DvalAA-14]|uniref:hypothetical protein n=1 Tax=unclassified Streptomyces TaxID=2593676 RepID=UPI00081B275B|nr:MULTISPECIES: hypothetical protein [unclassified Streptomyces]MYS21940.1 hypothetical protein [Streptomyces sp. SID4948]SCE04919.1 hypothetical protein GA0115240_136913 [Streptomyces sp. DvalAA-14]
MTHMESKPQDVAEAARHARFGVLPKRIRLEDTVEELPATVPDPAKNTYSDDDWLIHNVV